jgi:predicted nucleic acid-binding Zn ribbon protein
MPTYSFKNTDTGEEFDKFMSISAREEYLKDNPHIQQILTCAAICDPVRVGVTKRDSGFKEVLQKIHEKTAGSTLKKYNSW